MCYSSKENKKFIFGKIKTIYIPYIVLSIISIIIYFFMGRFIKEGLNTNIFYNLAGMIYANPNLENMQWNQPLWFLPCLMIQLIIINIIENIIKNNKSKQKIRVLIIVVTVIIGFILCNFKIYLPLQFEAALCMTIFTYLGIFLKENKTKIENNNLYKHLISKKIVTVLFIFVTIILSCILDNCNTTVSVMHDKYGNYLLFFAVSIVMIINVLLISELIDKIFKKQKIISYIGQSTLLILLLHKFPILFFQEICPIIKNVLNRDDTITNNMLAIVISIIVILMCMICKYIIDIIKKQIKIGV